MSIESDIQSPSAEGVVCPKCLRTNSTAAAFCADCGAPIGMVATIDSIQHIHAEGFAYRSAIDGPPKRIILLGMWLLFGPLTLIGPCLIFNRLADELPQTIVFNLLSACAIIILYRTTRNYLVKSRLAGTCNS